MLALISIFEIGYENCDVAFSNYRPCCTLYHAFMVLLLFFTLLLIVRQMLFPKIEVTVVGLITSYESVMQDLEKYKEPTSLFEHFIIAGLQPDANLEAVEDAFVKKKKWEQEMARTEMLDFNMLQYRRPTLPILEPQVWLLYNDVNCFTGQLLIIFSNFMY